MLKKIVSCLNMIYPVIFGVLFLILQYTFKVTYKVSGFEHLLESVITFSSIIIGFYSAMYGVLITLKDSDIFMRFRENGLTGIFRAQLYESLSSSFVILVVSVSLQVLKNYTSTFTNIVFLIFVFTLGWFLSNSFRAISLLLKIMFNNKDMSGYDRSDSGKDTHEWEKKINGIK